MIRFLWDKVLLFTYRKMQKSLYCKIGVNENTSFSVYRCAASGSRLEDQMIICARNQLAGEIVTVEEGAVNTIVTLKTDGGSTISSTISMAAVKELGLAPGVKAKAVIKSTSVMIGV